jgi:hypothetical protein
MHLEHPTPPYWISTAALSDVIDVSCLAAPNAAGAADGAPLLARP